MHAWNICIFVIYIVYWTARYAYANAFRNSYSLQLSCPHPRVTLPQMYYIGIYDRICRVFFRFGRQIKPLLTMWKMSHLHLPNELMKLFPLKQRCVGAQPRKLWMSLSVPNWSERSRSPPPLPSFPLFHIIMQFQTQIEKIGREGEREEEEEERQLWTVNKFGLLRHLAHPFWGPIAAWKMKIC